MAKGSNQKLKIMYLMRILLEQTDETHSISMPEILSELNQYGITAERKSIYNDMESLRQFGMDIIGEQRDRTYYYHVGKRQFELAELKLLVDSVQSAKFITAKKSNELIKKIESLASKHEATKLQRQVYVANRIKTMNGKETEPAASQAADNLPDYEEQIRQKDIRIAQLTEENQQIKARLGKLLAELADIQQRYKTQEP